FGLIERKRQGLGKPAKIYVKNFSGGSGGENNASEGTVNETVELAQNEEKIPAVQQEGAANMALFSASKGAVKTARAGQSGVPAEGSLDCPNRAANETEKKETELIETNPILPLPPRTFEGRSRYGRDLMDEMRWIREEIRENIDYEGLILDYPTDNDIFDGYVELMVEAACSSRETVRICGQDIPTAMVRSRFLKLEREHILYVRDCLCSTSTVIRNIKAYTLTALYSAPATMGQYYAALVSYDFTQDLCYHNFE
ncbi:MAG: replication initiator A domain-containing protein, partial [Dysosmobacter sp.]|nr:replication initiator A domain-containing protein [Dysosmobacter sp.]